MIRRTLTTLILLLSLGGILYLFGVHAGIWLIALLALASQHELHRMLTTNGWRAPEGIALASGAAVLLGPFYLAPAGLDPAMTGLGLLGIGIVLITLASLRRPAPQRMSSLAAGTLGLGLIAFPLHFFPQIVLMAEIPVEGLLLAVWVILTVKATDIGAYLAGTLLGRHKLAPELSPGKTREGAAGGLFASILVAGAFALILADHLPENFSPVAAAALAAPIALVSIPSDLLESAFKREAGIKDSGKTIPGIGGAYDLSDSLVLSAPVAYILLALVIFS